MPNKSPSPPTEPGDLTILASAVELEAAAAGGEPQPMRRFSMVAYTGGPMTLSGWRYPVVVDLEGLSVGRQKRPILLDHTRDVDFVMGQTDQVAVMNHQLIVGGQVMGDSPKAKQVIALNDKGFSWQASIGARAEQVEFVPDGKAVQVNGREVAGPVNVARRASLGEISFVVLGADDNTSAQIAAAAAERKEQLDMEFTQWLAAQGFSPDGLSEKQLASLQAMYDAREEPAGTPAATAVQAPDNPVTALRAEVAAESKRIAAVRQLCGGRFGEIEARAIGDGWDETRTELEVLRASRPKAQPVFGEDGSSHSARSIEAALCLSAGLAEPQVGKWFDDRTMEAALSRDLRGYGLHALLYDVIRAAGSYARPGLVNNGTIRAALEAERQIKAAGSGFSTISLAGILSNVGNKSMLASYQAVPRTSNLFCAETDANDFRQYTRYRMTGTGTFEKVGADGELKHGGLTEESYSNQLDTYGRIIALTRQMMINDDLGAFLQIPRIIGRQAALAVEEAVFTLLLANPGTFFDLAKSNYFEGATTNLQISSLTTAEQMFLDQKDSAGKPIALLASILLVPTALKVISEQLYTQLTVNETTTADKPRPASNPHAGKFRPVASPYLNSQGIAGSSATAWYLFADPNDVAAMEIGYLRGARAPTIESGETDFDTLGMKWRGYFDFGVALQDFRAAVKSKGAA
jgi:hypothetical protein